MIRKIDDLDNFPFKSMEEFNQAFNNGIAEPLVPPKIAKEWATKRSITLKRTLFLFIQFLILTSLIAIIYYSFRSELVVWYDSILYFFISTILVSALHNHKYRGLILIRGLGLIGLAAVCFWLYKSDIDYTILFILTTTSAFLYSLYERLSIRGIILDALLYEEILCELWSANVLLIRYKDDGKIVSPKD